MSAIRTAGRLTVLVVLLAFMSSCAAGADTSASADTTPSAQVPSPDISQPDISQPVNGVPYTVVATDGPPLGSDVLAATAMDALPAPFARPCPSSGACYATATPPPSSLLLLFEPVGYSCQRVTGYDIFLEADTLRIDVRGKEDCGTAHNVALAFAPSALLSIPLTALPATGTLTIIVNSFHGTRGGPPRATTTFNLG